MTPDGEVLRLRFIYYNNKLHAPTGTRNEYRITYLTKFLRDAGAKEGDTFEISKEDDVETYRIRVISREAATPEPEDDDGPVRIRLTTGWRRVHSHATSPFRVAVVRFENAINIQDSQISKAY